MTKEKKGDKDRLVKRSFVTGTMGYTNVYPKRDLWRKIGEDFNGTFKIGHNSGMELEILRLFIPYKGLEIKLSESDTRPLKFEIGFNTRIDYDLVIGLEDTIEKLLKRIGKKGIEIGDKNFDNKYLVKSNNINLTKYLLTQEIIDYIINHNVYSIAYSTNISKRTSELISVISRTICEKEIISDLILMHMKIIDQLEKLHLIE
jgi:hypothetical protein